MILERIDDPKDLKTLSIEEMKALAAEIRRFLIEKLSVTGGHLAPNLGVVELTIALHYLFDSPRDKIIFDVGHQSYVHKVLTGRKHRFDTLRKYKGLSGFIKRAESVHDVWEAGHSSTALSAAMGMAIARDLQGDHYRIVAIVGDGALTGGMALEALNHIGHERKKLMVVLNDNEMSIAPNVGALHNYLSRIRSDRHYLKAKEEVEYLLRKIPAIGGRLARSAERLKDSLKYLVMNGILFEELGYRYIGPVDGHDLPLLIDTLRRADQIADQIKGPVLVHVVTVKGKGYQPAEADSHTWHGLGPYKIESGEVLKTEGPPTYTDVFGKTLVELARDDSRIVAVTPAMPKGSGLELFARAYPGRMFDVGIAEQHAATMCAALALSGMKPVFAVYSTFLQRAYDQVLHDICRQNANVVFAIDRAGLVGADGDTHQGLFDIAFLRSMPNMVLMMPKDENELRHMLKTALAYDAGPIAVRYPRAQGVGVPLDAELKPIPIGSWERLRTGRDVAILAVGPMVALALEAAERLERQGVTAEVINARFLKPLDEAMLMELAERGMEIIAVEEGVRLGGFGSAVLEFLADRELWTTRVRSIAVPDRFVDHGSIAEQRAEVGLTVDRIVETVLRAVGGRPVRSRG
ncbi:MAG: 1-deoxy-D-xylulose-5-phosphate synthase [Candidatus Reconcilbacillus cellulovorans]|mgnify:FL=1|uniref:1-deoxy-D-xylulose-5-phosphate synthase n=1 Tax=Candidatus Reconcilbacillus cellulovorans TaxID=1906605 RepID=A0A2A6E294_9BACL|nr:MAG: 1-deoxy-D-xylulose-5-phosphate synthase [Candidatus Reconcilbacillus cellulovorans]